VLKKILVCGSNGQLGVELIREFEARGYAVTGLGRSKLDLTDQARVDECIDFLDPAVVVNAAAYNQVDVAEKEAQSAFLVNALAVRHLARACRQIDAQLVHFSTDYVFDGRKGSPYTEEDTPHPLGAYGVSKLAGEFYAQAYLESPLIIRTSGVFGPGGLHTPRGNFIELMLRLATSRNPIRVVQDHVASPTYAPTLASRTADLVGRKAGGVFHIGGGTPISWFDYARMIFDVTGLQPVLHGTSEREYRTPARRPKYSALSNSKMERFGLAPMPPLEEELRRYLEARRRLVGD
jgi:dTDP-4-dehydrorhamnose reductase